MATNGNLNFANVNKVTFEGVGGASNAVIDTTTGKIGVGVDSPDANLHVVGNCFVSTNFELGGTMTMGTVTVRAQHELSAITATGNTTPHTVEFQNAETGLVTTGNVEVGGELAVSGNVAVDTDTLFVDSVNNRVGVGTTSPDNALHIRNAIPAVLLDDSDDDTKVRITGGAGGDLYVDSNWGGSGNTGDIIFREASSEKMRIAGNGNVGIGTTIPSHALTVAAASGDAEVHIQAQGNDGGDAILYFNGSPTNQRKCAIISSNVAPNAYCKQDLHFCMETTDDLTDVDITDSKMVITNGGNVGIGTSTPRTNLHVGQQLSTGNGNTIPAAGLGISADFPSSTHAWFANRVNATGDEYWGLAVGTIYTGSSYLQNLNKNTGTYYDILLQPNGGNVGIGTTSPQDKLHTDIIRIGDWSGGGNGYKFSMDTNAYLQVQYMTGQTVYKDIMTLRYDTGNVGIGTTNPGAKLDIKGVIKISGSTSGGYQLSTDSTGNHLNFTHGSYSWGKWANAHHYDVYSASDFTGSRALYLNYYSGAAVRLTGGTAVSSDDRIKTNERYITNATGTLLKLKPQIYDKGPSLGGGTGKTHVESGLIVQDIYYDAPELRHLVHYDDDAKIPDEKPYVDDDPQMDPDYSMWGTKSAGLNYEGLIAYLIKSNQELHARIQALENVS